MMNNKGLFNFVFGLVGLFVLIMILAVLIPIQQDVSKPEEIYSVLDNASSQALVNMDINSSNSPIINVAYSFIHFILYSSFEVVKFGVKYATDNPDFVNAKTLLLIVMISLLAPILYYAFLSSVVIFLLVREWVLQRRERKIKERIKERKR